MAESGETASSSVLTAKLARRKLQHDVELLSNRVERLRQEERKAKQKVLETRLRGQEIAALQKRNEQAATAKALAKRMELEQQERERAAARVLLGERHALEECRDYWRKPAPRPVTQAEARLRRIE